MRLPDEFADVITAAEKMLEEGWKTPAEIVDGYDFNRIVYLGANALKGIAPGISAEDAGTDGRQGVHLL